MRGEGGRREYNSQEMTCGAKVEHVVKSNTIGAITPVLLQDSLAQISSSSLAELCSRLRVQLIQQRLPLICFECRPNLVRAFNMELNLTQMLRGLCKTCRGLFTSSQAGFEGPNSMVSSSRIPPAVITPNIPITPASVRKVILKMTSGLDKSKRNAKPVKKEALRSDVPIFEAMTAAGVDWCRYCGTTNGVNWRPGPWGQRTLCNKHGCAYHGYGFSKGLPRLDLFAFRNESISDRIRPVQQEICTKCQIQNSGRLLYCYGCPRAYHAECLDDGLSTSKVDEFERGGFWFCSESCPQNYARRTVLSSPIKERSQRVTTSEGSPVVTQRRFAKRLEAPPTPPPTPSFLGRKRRMASDMSSEIMVCFEPEAIIKKNLPDRTLVFTPAYIQIPFPPREEQLKKRKAIECLDDTQLLLRHARYEEVEKTMRLCRPEVLRSLYSKATKDLNIASNDPI